MRKFTTHFHEMYSILRLNNVPHYLVGRVYYLKDQLLRATLSISNNIAEGYERQTENELVRFLYIARGSAGEVRSMLLIAKKLDLLGEDKLQKYFESINIVYQQNNSEM